MTQYRHIWVICSFIILCLAILLNLSAGSKWATPWQVVDVFIAFDDSSYSDFIIKYQRLPRTLIAIFVGAAFAMGGDVLQGITRNPLASPSLLGITSGAVFFVVFFGFYMAVPVPYHGFIAFAGGWFGFGCCYFVAKMAGVDNDPRGLTLILAGAVISVLLMSIANALVLADQGLWALLRSWIKGDINHAYIERLNAMWWFGVICMVGLYAIARPLSLIVLGTETAQSAGVNVKLYIVLAVFFVVGSSSVAVSIIGPVGFIGLVVPHIVRPFVGTKFQHSFIMNACVGGAVGCIVDTVARTALLPIILHTAVVSEFMGGLVFILMVRRFYISKSVRGGR